MGSDATTTVVSYLRLSHSWLWEECKSSQQQQQQKVLYIKIQTFFPNEIVDHFNLNDYYAAYFHAVYDKKNKVFEMETLNFNQTSTKRKSVLLNKTPDWIVCPDCPVIPDETFLCIHNTH